jgi:ABC-2 type transport system ATP-binding protein
VDEWLERLDLAGRAKDRVAALSHGNQQRVQLIAALLNEPELIVLDEPFSGLDPLAIATMSDVLEELATKGTAVLFSSHQLDLVEGICEDVAIIDHGRIVQAGELAALRAAVPQRFVVSTFMGDPPDWSRLRSAQVVDTGANRVRLRVERDTDITDVIDLIRTTAELVTVSYEPPSLSELFREAVSP